MEYSIQLYGLLPVTPIGLRSAECGKGEFVLCPTLPGAVYIYWRRL